MKTNLKFKVGDRVTNKTFGNGTIDDIQSVYGDKVYLISIDKSSVGRSVEVNQAHKEYTLITR